MNEALQNLIEALREELKQYGEMLALLDRQRQFVRLPQGGDLPPSAAEVEEQAEAIRVARCEREQRFRDMARTFQPVEVNGFDDLIALLPREYRPLLEALVEENKALLQRIQKRARKEQSLPTASRT